MQTGTAGCGEGLRPTRAVPGEGGTKIGCLILLFTSEAEMRAEIQRELGRIEEFAAYSRALVTRKKRAPSKAARTAKPAKRQSARTHSRGKGDEQ